MHRKLALWLILAGLALLVASLWQRHQLPEPGLLIDALREEPQQQPVREPPRTTTVNGVTYSIKPLYAYDLTGLVVSRHDSDSWIDYIHREWNDHLNVVDLCVIWGKNAVSGAYRGQSFSSGQFVCYWQAPTREAYAAFDPTAISNNHLLTDDPAIAKTLRAVRVGDQIRFRGWLAEYSHRHNGQSFHRGTSTVRTDTGNGACETVYVQDITIIRRGGGPWRALTWVAWVLLTCGCIAWFTQPLGGRD